MTVKENITFDLDNYNESDLTYFSFRESLRLRWKELKHTFHNLKRSPLFFVGFSIIMSMIILAILAPTIAPYKCTFNGFLGAASCDNAQDNTKDTILNNLPPLTRDTRITSITWSPFEHVTNQFDLGQNVGAFSSNIPSQSSVLVGTTNGSLSLYHYKYDYTNDKITFTQNTTFPLPAVPANLTTVIPATGDINNDSRWDIILGGNTGEIYLSMNNGTLVNPIWTPFEPLTNVVTNQTVQYNGTTSPTLVEFDRDFTASYGGGVDLLVTSSGDDAIHYLMQRPTNNTQDYGQAFDGSGYVTIWKDKFINANLTFQDIGNPVRTTDSVTPWRISEQLNGSGLLTLQAVNMDPTSKNTTDLIFTFETGQTYVLIKQGPITLITYGSFTSNSSRLLFVYPPIPTNPGVHYIISDFTNDGRVDMLIFEPNGTILFADQYAHIDGRLHILGTEGSGGDIFSKILYALQFDLIVAVLIVGITVFIGVTIGSISGYFGGFVDNLFMRVTDIFFAFPDLILAMSITAALGGSMINIITALVVVDWAGTARLMRGQVLAEKTRLYVESAKASGLGDFRIIFKHVLPNSIYPIIVTATLGLGGVILSLAGLAFLGFGPQQGAPELGRMITDGRTYINSAPWIIFFPGLVIMLIVLAFNLIGDALRDILDPRLRR